jgi:predicted nucleotidyltransferase
VTDDRERVAQLLTAALLRDLGDEVDLVFRYGSTVRGTRTHRFSDIDISYVPVHEETSHALTVMVGTTMCDLYPIRWSKLERMAELDDPSASILLDARIVHQRTDAAAERFSRLGDRLRANLAPAARGRMLTRAHEIFMRTGYPYYLLRTQAERGHRFGSLFHARQVVGGVLHAVAVANQRCVDTRRLSDVLELDRLPERFAPLLDAATRASEPAAALDACEALMASVRDFLLAEQRDVHRGEPSFADALDASYPELMGDLQHAVIAAEDDDPWRLTVIPMLHELMLAMAEARTGVSYSAFNSPPEYAQDLEALGFPDLLGLAAARDFEGVRRAAPAFADRLRSYLAENGAALNAFSSVEELRAFLGLPGSDGSGRQG